MFAQSADALALKLIRSLLRVETESDSQLPRIDSQTAIRIQLFRALVIGHNFKNLFSYSMIPVIHLLLTIK